MDAHTLPALGLQPAAMPLGGRHHRLALPSRGSRHSPAPLRSDGGQSGSDPETFPSMPEIFWVRPVFRFFTNAPLQ